jgi:hypothetical protein
MEKKGIEIPDFTEMDDLPDETRELIDSLLRSGEVKNSVNPNSMPLQELFQQQMKTWKGERFVGGMWVPLPEGMYYDYYDEELKKGIPELSFFDWYCEFINNDENYVNPIKMGKCHKEWSDIIENTEGYIMFLCSRDHYKSSFLIVGYCLYHICEKPDIAKQGIMMVSWAEELSEDNMYSVQKNLLENQRILSYYGELFDTTRKLDKKSMFFNYQPIGGRPGLICVALKAGNITGRHPALVLMDDIEDEELSEVLMSKIRRIFMKKLFPAVGTSGRIIVAGTLKGHNKDNDIYLWLETRNIFSKYVFPAADAMPPSCDVTFEIEEKQVRKGRGWKTEKKYNVTVLNREKYQLLYPERYTIEDLVIKQRLLSEDKGGDRVFWAEYFLRPLDPESMFFKLERIGFFPIDGLRAREFSYIKKEKIIGPYLWIDPGGKGKASHGNTIVIVAKDQPMYGNRYYLLYIKRARLGVKECAELVQHLYYMYQCEGWGVEGNFNQADTHGNSMYEFFKAVNGSTYTPYPIIKNNELPKLMRIRDNFSLMIGKEGQPLSFFVDETTEDYQDFIDELQTFPVAVEKKGEFDIIDAVCSCKTFCLDQDNEVQCSGYGWTEENLSMWTGSSQNLF